MKNFLKLLSLTILLITTNTNAAPAPIQFSMIPEESSITFEATQNNSPVAGEFKKFTTDIAFHPEALEQSKVKVMVDMGSVWAAYDEVPTTLKAPDWFDTSAFPQAIFETTGFKSLGDNKYEAASTLTIKEYKIPVTFTFTLNDFSETSASITGETILKRTDFHIGWDDTSAVLDEVRVTVKLKVTAQKTSAQ